MKPTGIAIVGGGPAALMAADSASRSGQKVTLYEKRAGIGRKLAIAGSSGLNITHAAPFPEFISYYQTNFDFWKSLFEKFGREQWLSHLHEMGFKTFEGTSRRYFIEDMNAARLLRLWREKLEKQNVSFVMSYECVDFRAEEKDILLRFKNGTETRHTSCVFALGGASYLGEDSPLNWPDMFRARNIEIVPFAPSNVGFRLDWSEAFLKEALRKPLKNVVLKSTKGEKRGDVLVTEYGLEGTPIYFVGEKGSVVFDLKPDLTEAQMMEKCEKTKENLSPLRRVQKYLNLDEVALALLYHYADEVALSSLPLLISRIKAFPLEFKDTQPLEEAISTRGGIALSELDENLMLIKHPGMFVAGEMLNWDAPTGGFLIQGCVSQGYVAGAAASR